MLLMPNNYVLCISTQMLYEVKKLVKLQQSVKHTSWKCTDE